MSSAPPSAPGVVRPRDAHRLAEMRSLLLHRAVAERIEGDATIVARASANLAKWRADGLLQDPHCDAWMRELSQGTASLVAFLCSDDERARELRQVTPFTFVISPRERWALWKRAGSLHPQVREVTHARLLASFTDTQLLPDP